MNLNQTTSLILSAGICLSCTLASPSTAQAQSKDDIKRAKKLFIKGRKQLKANKNKDAIELFEEALKLSKRSAILFYVGQAYDQDGQLLKARKFYQQYLDKVPDAPNVEDVLDTILKLQQRIRKAYARISVTTEKPGREIFINRESTPRCKIVDASACRLTLKPGNYTLVIKSGEGKPAPTKKKRLSLKAGDKLKLKFKLQAAIAKLLVKSDVDGAQLNVAGQSITLPMDAPLKLKPGRYPLVLKKQDGTSWTGKVTVEEDKLAQIYIPMQHTSSKTTGTSVIRIVSYALMGTGAGLLVGGMWMGSQTGGTFEVLEKQKLAGNVDPNLVTQGQSQQFGANTLLITGTLALLGGGGLFAWDFFGESDKTASASEEVTPTKKLTPKKSAPDPDKDLL